jgi:cytochrome c-type biogenesis protein CcmF
VEERTLIADIGYISLIIALFTALYSAVAAVYGARRDEPRFIESARHAMLLTWPLLSLSTVALVWLLVDGQFQIQYVASVTSNSMPTYLKITALWGGQEGSLLFWAWLMSAFAFAVSVRKWDRDREFLPWVVFVAMVTLLFFLSLIVFFENPFRRLWMTSLGEQVTSMLQPAGTMPLIPADGRGLNPLLRHPGMIIHPPMLYLGFVSFVIPYAFAIAALITGRSDDRWIRITRRWTLVAWLFLSLGLVLGARWAYDVLGWGGYWGWDPVEIAAFMPWLTGTAFLHSVMVQEKRGMFKQWNVILIVLTYILVILGTFLTRSGVLSSVHAFAQSAIGPMFFVFIGIMFIGSGTLLISRWNDLRGENEIPSWFSREVLFLLNNFLFIVIAAVCLLGVLFPIASELFTGMKVTVGPPWYERITAPLWIALLILMGIAPLSAYGRHSARALGRSIWVPLSLSLVVPIILAVRGMRNFAAYAGAWSLAFVVAVTLYEFWRAARARQRRHSENILRSLLNLFRRNRRRYGGYVIHLGVVLMAMGIIGIEMFQSETQATLAVGESLNMDRYSLRYDSLTQFQVPGRQQVTRAVVSVFQDGKFVGELYPRQDFFPDAQQSMTIPGLRSMMDADLYVLLVGWESIGLEAATFKVYLNPLVNFLWLGAVVFILGTAIAAWPEKDEEFLPRKTAARMAAAGI